MRSVSFARYGILLILLLGFFLRLALAQASVELPIRADEKDYTRLAVEIMQDPLGYQGTFRPPLYPYSLALSFTILGGSRFASAVVQALLATVNIALVYALAQTLFHRRGVSLLSAFIFALALEFVTITRLYFADTLFFLFSTLGFWLLFKGWRSPNPLPLALVGVAFALASLAREVLGLFALVVVPFWIVLTLAPKWRQGLIGAAVFAVGFAAVIVPWTLRNLPIEGRIVFIGTSGEYNFARDNWREEAKVGIPPNLEGVFLAGKKKGKGKVTVNYMKQLYTELRAAPPSQRGALAMERGMAVIRYDPVRWFMVKVQRLNTLLKPAQLKMPYLRLQELDKPLKALLYDANTVMFWGILLFAGVGLLLARDSAPKLLILLYVLFSLATFIVTHYMPRYRLPLLILFLPYTAFGLMWVVDWLQSRFQWKPAATRALRGEP